MLLQSFDNDTIFGRTIISSLCGQLSNVSERATWLCLPDRTTARRTRVSTDDMSLRAIPLAVALDYYCSRLNSGLPFILLAIFCLWCSISLPATFICLINYDSCSNMDSFESSYPSPYKLPPSIPDSSEFRNSCHDFVIRETLFALFCGKKRVDYRLDMYMCVYVDILLEYTYVLFGIEEKWL